MIRDRSGDSAWDRRTSLATNILLCALVAYTAWYLLRYSDFSNDDIDSLVFMTHTGFWTFLFTPTDVHYVPLHQLLSWLVYHIAPMEFAAPVAVLTVFHIGTLIYLRSSLRLLGAGHVAGLLVCAYAASSLIIVSFVWWAHAEHRVPYVFLDVCVIYHYLAWLEQPRRRHLFIAAIAFIAAFGFYEKAVFIPLHMLFIGYLNDEPRFRKQLRHVAWPPCVLALGSLAFVITYLHFLPASVRVPLPLALRADLEFVKVLFAGASGLGIDGVDDIPVHGLSLRLVALLLIGCALVALSYRRKRGSWKILAAMFIVVLVDYLPIAVSERIRALGLNFTHQYRFHYEELQLIVLFFGMWCARVASRSAPPRRQKWAWSVGFVALIIYASVNAGYLRAGRGQVFSWAWDLDYSHIYLARLRAGLKNVGAAPVFENDKLPGYLAVYHLTPDTSGLLPLFRPDIHFSEIAIPRYKVLSDGHVVLVQ